MIVTFEIMLFLMTSFLITLSKANFVLNRKVLFEQFGYTNESSQIQLNSKNITQVEVNTFESFYQLKSLFLFDNQITFLDSDSFHDLIQLEELSIEKNKLTSLDFKIFSSLSNLKVLLLDNNKIKSFHPNIFQNLINLERLELQ